MTRDELEADLRTLPDLRQLEVVGNGTLVATVVSGSFEGQDEAVRQRTVWGLLRGRHESQQPQSVSITRSPARSDRTYTFRSSAYRTKACPRFSSSLSTSSSSTLPSGSTARQGQGAGWKYEQPTFSWTRGCRARVAPLAPAVPRAGQRQGSGPRVERCLTLPERRSSLRTPMAR